MPAPVPRTCTPPKSRRLPLKGIRPWRSCRLRRRTPLTRQSHRRLAAVATSPACPRSSVSRLRVVLPTTETPCTARTLLRVHTTRVVSHPSPRVTLNRARSNCRQFRRTRAPMMASPYLQPPRRPRRSIPRTPSRRGVSCPRPHILPLSPFLSSKSCGPCRICDPKSARNHLSGEPTPRVGL